MGIGLRIALGGLGRGIQQGVDDYSREQQRVRAEELANSRYDQQVRRDDMNEAVAVAREGGVIGNLPPGYNPDGSLQTGRSAMRPGSYVGQSSASTEAPYATEHNPARPMKKIGTIHDQDVWVPSDGMTPDAYQRKVERDQKKAEFDAALPARQAAVGKFKYTHPGPGQLAGLSDPQSGDNLFEMMNRNEMEADPAYQQRAVDKATKIYANELPGKKELKAAPGSGGGGTSNQDRIKMRQEITGVNTQIQQKGQQIREINTEEKNLPYVSKRDTTAPAYRTRDSTMKALEGQKKTLRHERDSLSGYAGGLNAQFQQMGRDTTAVPGMTPAPYVPLEKRLTKPDWSKAPPEALKELQEVQLLYHRNQDHKEAYSAYSEAISDIIRTYHVPQN